MRRQKLGLVWVESFIPLVWEYLPYRLKFKMSSGVALVPADRALERGKYREWKSGEEFKVVRGRIGGIVFHVHIMNYITYISKKMTELQKHQTLTSLSMWGRGGDVVQVVEHSAVKFWILVHGRSILHGGSIYSLGCFLFQPVVHNWSIKRL